jgi:hypothetical protein
MQQTAEKPKKTLEYLFLLAIFIVFLILSFLFYNRLDRNSLDVANNQKIGNSVFVKKAVFSKSGYLVLRLHTRDGELAGFTTLLFPDSYRNIEIEFSKEGNASLLEKGDAIFVVAYEESGSYPRAFDRDDNRIMKDIRGKPLVEKVILE